MTCLLNFHVSLFTLKILDHFEESNAVLKNYMIRKSFIIIQSFSEHSTRRLYFDENKYYFSKVQRLFA